LLADWQRQFRFFLKALGGADCPLCALADNTARSQIEEMARRPPRRMAVCGAHLSALAGIVAHAASRTALVKAALNNSLDGTGVWAFECDICRAVEAAGGRVASIIRLLDRSLRFEKALERGPLFCHRHIARIVGHGRAPAFARIERRKLEELINEISQAQLLRRADLQDLIDKAAAYLGAPSGIDRKPPAEAGQFDNGTDGLAQAAAHQFAQWEEEQKTVRLDRLESEVASLRYRNAVLSEENRRYKLAHAAVEALRCDLERDRAALHAQTPPDNKERV
jgi:hypothetical protein